LQTRAREQLSNSPRASAQEVFWIFLRLGLTSFGGPTAHIGFFREEFVAHRRWLDEGAFADLVALCQMLPGPASSQLGLAIGLRRAGCAGAAAAWLGFTLPSALLLVGFAYGVTAAPQLMSPAALQALKVVAVAVVAHALRGMAASLCPDPVRRLFAVVAAGLALLVPSTAGQLVVLAVGAMAGLKLAPVPASALRSQNDLRVQIPQVPGVPASPAMPHPRLPAWRGAAIALGVLAALLVALPVATRLWPQIPVVGAVDAFFRAGAMVFGGGHVVLPVLRAEVVAPGLVPEELFLAGYGAAQAVPGPLFTFAAYLGAVMHGPPAGTTGALLCLLAIFSPSFLLVAGVMPLWDRVREASRLRRALSGINAAVVGLLLAALYDPVWIAAVRLPVHAVLVLVAWLALGWWRLPPWLVVSVAVAGGIVTEYLAAPG
jgi:chromate transporter